MKVTLQEQQETTAPIKYPILMEFIDPEVVPLRKGKLIVRFTDRTHGMAVYDAGDYVGLFQPSGTWVESDDKTKWKPFTGKLILEN